MTYFDESTTWQSYMLQSRDILVLIFQPTSQTTPENWIFLLRPSPWFPSSSPWLSIIVVVQLNLYSKNSWFAEHLISFTMLSFRSTIRFYTLRNCHLYCVTSNSVIGMLEVTSTKSTKSCSFDFPRFLSPLPLLHPVLSIHRRQSFHNENRATLEDVGL